MGKEMWEDYAKQAGGVTFDGKPLPTWDELGEERQACWKAAAETLLRVLEQVHNDIELALMSDDGYCKTIENDNKQLREEIKYLKTHAISEQYKAESEGEERGYRMGYVDGHSDGAESESEAFRRGYNEGLADGMGTE